jgi:hypothetical protein
LKRFLGNREASKCCRDGFLTPAPPTLHSQLSEY